MNLKQEAEQFLKERYGMSDFNSYQRIAKTTAIYPATNKILYPALGLAGEAGEVPILGHGVLRCLRHQYPAIPANSDSQIALIP